MVPYSWKASPPQHATSFSLRALSSFYCCLNSPQTCSLHRPLIILPLSVTASALGCLSHTHADGFLINISSLPCGLASQQPSGRLLLLSSLALRLSLTTVKDVIFHPRQLLFLIACLSSSCYHLPGIWLDTVHSPFFLLSC